MKSDPAQKLSFMGNQNLHFISMVAIFLPALFILLLLAIISSCKYSFLLLPEQHITPSFPSSLPSVAPPVPSISPTKSLTGIAKDCDIFRGEWIPDAEALYYRNNTCFAIQEEQNCMKYGRPDLEFLRWRWKPHGCELPRFEQELFLEFMRSKSLAFVGDSLARNHMQSLLCLLLKVANPKEISSTTGHSYKRYFYHTYNFTISIFWSPFLVRSEVAATSDDSTGPWILYLDEPDGWFSEITDFDYIIISGASWFTRHSMFYERGQLIGCNLCFEQNITDHTLLYSHRMAYRTVLRTISALENLKTKIIVRTLSPSHYENGEWNNGGDCTRTRPYRSNDDMSLGWLELEFYGAQVEEFKEASKMAKAAGSEWMLMDTTHAMLLRPDGHPSRYRHWPDDNVTWNRDCVHWCLPGPIDVWNDMLLQMLLV